MEGYQIAGIRPAFTRGDESRAARRREEEAVSAFPYNKKNKLVVHLTTKSCLRVSKYIVPLRKSRSVPIKCIPLLSLSRLSRLEMGAKGEKSTTNVQMRKRCFQSIDIFCARAHRLNILLVSHEALSQDRESWNDSRTPRLEP
jgi:hypothetical protein